MIKLKKLSLRNFLSYGNNETVFNLDKTGTTLILGEDLDNTANGRGANGVGKAQPLHCKVKIPGGWTTIGEIKAGDIITAADGTPTSVVGVYPQGSRPVYKITFADGRQTEADEQHLWSVFSHRWGQQTARGERLLTTLQLQEYVQEAKNKNKAWYNIFVPIAKPEQLNSISLPISPYLLGCLLGDGSKTTRRITFTNKDPDVIERANELLLEHDQQLRSYTNDLNYNIRSTGSRVNDIADKLHNLNLLGCNSYTKFIPNIYKNANHQQKIDLLRGLLDTDGTVGKTQNVSFSTSSKTLADDVQYVVRSIGGKAKISTRQPYYTHKEESIMGAVSYNVSIDFPTPKELFSVKYKLDRLNDKTQYANAGLRVTGVEYIGEKTTQCIMIDHPEHLYVTDDFIVTHNTTIINALCFALYDKPLSNISKDNLINNINKKSTMEVILDFDARGVNYIIKRTRTKKGSSAAQASVYLFENGEDVTLDSVVNTNLKIEQALGMPFELFVRIVVFSASHIPFLDLPTKMQTEIIEGLFGLTSLSQRAESLKDIIKDTEKNLEVAKVKIEAEEREEKKIQEQIENVRRRIVQWDQQQQTLIGTLETQIKKAASVDVPEQRQLHTLISNLKEQMRSAATEQSTLSKDLRLKTKEKRDLEAQLLHLEDAKCPYCLQKYQDATSKISTVKQTIIALDASIKTIDQDLLHVTELIEKLNIKLEKTEVTITVDEKELDKIQRQQGTNEANLQAAKTAVNPHLETLNELSNLKPKNIDFTKVNELSSEIDHQKFLLKLLTKKDSFVRKALLNKNIPYLNARLQHYLSLLGMPHKVEFTHEMTAGITQFGRELDFGNLSAGQRARVNIALSFAFRDVLQSLHTKVNICMLDEVLDVGLDGVGVQSAARLIKRKAHDEDLSVFIISHRDEIDNAFDQTMTIQLHKGFSHIKGQKNESLPMLS